MQKLNITTKEFTMLNTILNSDYHDGNDPVDNPVWFENPFQNQETASGVVSSLVKKGLVNHQDYDDKNEIIWLTQKGFNVLNEILEDKKQ